MSSGRDRMARKDQKYAEVKNFWGDPEKAKQREADIQKRIRDGLPDLFVKKCEVCDTPLGWGMSQGGKGIWLDLKARVFCPVFEKSDSHGVVVVQTQLAFVDHKELCQGPVG